MKKSKNNHLNHPFNTMLMYRSLFSSAILCLLLIACGNKSDQSGNVANAATEANKPAAENALSMKINGVEWKADHSIFGAFHPKGHNRVVMISGSKGPKNKSEQLFNINIYNTTGPGIFQFQDGNPDFSVAQLANVSPENYIYGSMMGFTMKVNLTKASTAPDVVEATFEGELKGNAGDVPKITEGRFYYHE